MANINDEIKKEFLIEFGKNVRKIRKNKKLTQVDLSVRINMDDKKISRIERGLYDIKLSSLLIIAKSLEVNVLELIDLKKLDYYQKNIWE